MKTKDRVFIRYGLRNTGYRLFESKPRRVAVGQRGAILPLVAGNCCPWQNWPETGDMTISIVNCKAQC